MRVHLSARALPGLEPANPHPVLLTIRSAHWISSHAEHRTTAPELLGLLRRRTEVNALILERFHHELRERQNARLFNIDLKDDVLEQLGFFLD
jgi:hypothetical protein